MSIDISNLEYMISVRTMVIDDHEPYVVLQLDAYDITTEMEYVVAALKLTPNEAREQAHTFMEAAEASESSANLIVSLREQKVMEETVQAVLDRMRQLRDRE